MASGNESDVVLNFRMDGQVEYAKTVKQINNEMNLAAAEYKRHVSAMDSDATATEKLRATKEKLEKQLGLAERRTALLREEYEKSVRETGEYSEQSQKLYKQLLNSETGENKLRSALEQTNEALQEQGNLSVDTAEKLQKIEDAGEKVKGVGEKLSILSAGIVGIGAASLAAFSEVDEALDTIIVKTGATGEQADRLAESFENVAGNTHLELQTVGEAIGEVNTQFGFMDEKLESATDLIIHCNFGYNGITINDHDVIWGFNRKPVVTIYRYSGSGEANINGGETNTNVLPNIPNTKGNKVYRVDDLQFVNGIWQVCCNNLVPVEFDWTDNGIACGDITLTDAKGNITANQITSKGSYFIIPEINVNNVGETQKGSGNYYWLPVQFRNGGRVWLSAWDKKHLIYG